MMYRTSAVHREQRPVRIGGQSDGSQRPTQDGKMSNHTGKPCGREVPSSSYISYF